MTSAEVETSGAEDAEVEDWVLLSYHIICNVLVCNQGAFAQYY